MPYSWLRGITIAEAVSYLCLLAAVVAKRVFAQPAGVSVIGPIHGLVFLAYVVAIIAAVIPFGGYVVERRLLQER